MNILKFTVFILTLSTVVKSDNTVKKEIDKVYKEEISVVMCRSSAHRFVHDANGCAYCAQGLHFDTKMSQCTGKPDVIGKCFDEDHYHAKTQECVYCAEGYNFNEKSKKCEQVKI